MKQKMLSIDEQIASGKKTRLYGFFTNVIMISLLLGYYFTKNETLFNVFSFSLVAVSIYTIPAVILCIYILKSIWSLDDEESKIGIYIFFRNLYLLTTHSKILMFLNYAITFFEILFLVIFAHFFLASLALILLTITLSIHFLTKSFTIDEDIEKYILGK